MKNSKGFTLIELLIVITIIGILAVAFLPSMLGAPSKARDTQRKADLQKFAGVLTNASILGKLPAKDGCIKADGSVGDTSFFNAADFGGKIPVDPSVKSGSWTPKGAAPACTNSQYYYKKAPGTGYAFGVYAHMENKENANINCNRNTGDLSKVIDSSALPTADTDNAWCFGILVQK